MAASRMQRWELTLGAYEYKIVYKRGRDHGNADAMSRLPSAKKEAEVPCPGDLLLLREHMETQLPVTADQIRDLTSKDPTLSQVRWFILQGWPN